MENELPIPPTARSDKNCRELIRAWAANNGLHCSLSVCIWGDNELAAWGIVLTDVVQHVANALHEEKGWDKAKTIQEIRRVFNAELGSPTTEASGKFHTQ